MSESFSGPTTFKGAVRFLDSDVSLPAGLIDDADVSAGAAIDADKLQHRHAISYSQVDGTDVASATQLLFIARAACTVVSVEVRPTTAPTGGDKQFTVDIQKATDGSGSWSTLLSSVVTMSSADSDDTLEAATLIGSPTLVDGDAIRVVVTASGSTGSQGQGVNVTVNLDEAAA